ncbi:hypothetical protein TNCV_3594911 [Trichonephila clavipes]|nr:hypothetical protein TNCV_3594911 [Trichonephila clavipes]
MPNTSYYNLRPRKRAKEESRPSSEKRTKKEDQFDPEETVNNSTAPTPRSRRGHQQHCEERIGGANNR